MSASRSSTRTLGLVTAIGSAALALRPVPVCERALDLALLPGRVLASLALPFGTLAAREGEVARARRAERDALDLELHRALEARVRRAAWPPDGTLAPHIGAVQAEVLGSAPSELDFLRLAVAEPERVDVGQPVVAGDAYVGLVARIPGREPPPPAPRGLLERLAQRLGLGARRTVHAPDVVLVELITARDARIGAAVVDTATREITRLVVGGLAPLADATVLAAHNPERATARGVVRVHEPEALAGELSVLAHGFRIGDLGDEVAPIPGAGFGRALAAVRPYLDYEAGLHQVLVLTADGRQERTPERERTVLSDGRWRSARFLVRFEASPWREGRKLDLGRQHGVEAGAAVVSGARLVGRVARAGLALSDVALPGDVGFRFSALAELEGVRGEGSAPLVLGRLVSLGRAEDGRVRFEWRPQRALGGGEAADGGELAGVTLPVTLWTGSGEAGVPRGLLVGTAALPVGPGPHVVLVEQADGARDPRGLVVRTGRGRGEVQR